MPIVIPDPPRHLDPEYDRPMPQKSELTKLPHKRL